MAYLKFVHGWHTLSALFAAAPGALAQAMALAQDTGANVRAIAMVQTVRLFILAVALPLIFAAFGVAGLPPPRGGNLPLLQSLIELGVLVLASSGAALLAFRFNMPGGLIVGAMAASGVLHGGGWVHAFLPVPVAIGSFIVMGAMIGTRLGGADIRQLARLGLVGIGALASAPRSDACSRPASRGRSISAPRRRGDGLCAGRDRGDDHHRVRPAPRSGVRRRASPRALHLHVAGAAGRGRR